MIFDKKEHKEIVLQLIDSGSFSGKILEAIVELKQAVLKARISETEEIKPFKEKN